MPGNLLAYGIVALAILATLGGIVYKIHHAGYEEGVEEVRKELQPKLDSCNAAIEAQNRAVSALKAEGEAKVKKAQEGLRAAQNGARRAQDEAARLRGLAQIPSEASDCKAAVAEIRRGLVEK